MITSSAAPRRLWDLLKIVLLLGPLYACCTVGTAARTTSGAGAAELGKSDLRADVRIVVVLRNGRTIPEKVCVRRGVQIVMWVGDGDKLTVSFPTNPKENPFDQIVPCEGRFCGHLFPPKLGAEYNKLYKYTIRIEGAGQRPVEVDPTLEVVP